jgi:hypothetical protein
MIGKWAWNFLLWTFFLEMKFHLKRIKFSFELTLSSNNKPGMNSGALEGKAVPAPLVTPVVLI